METEPFSEMQWILGTETSTLDKVQKQSLKIQFKLHSQHSVLINVPPFLSNT
jgi:hypothetical protein